MDDSTVMLGDQALEKLLRDYEFETVLDIGSGKGEQAEVMRAAGKTVTTMDPVHKADYRGYFPIDDLLGRERFDVIWCCHVLEHELDPHNFLLNLNLVAKPGGIVAITVPPFRQVVAGHLTAWNAGLLLYHLVLANFDCCEAAVKTYGYNISVLVRNAKSHFMRLSARPESRLIDIAHFFPVPLTGERPKIGVLPTDIDEVNW
jgi:SAM-dependent methyltransferase